MTIINNAYINALLADAVYVDGLQSNMSGAKLLDVLSIRMTLPLSKFISDNFIIVDSTGDSGFNATVWRGKVGAPYADNVYVSMRGTQGGFDLAQDF